VQGWLHKPNQLPVADASPDQSVSSGDLAFFDGSNSYDPDGTVVSYEWDFGDGETAEGHIVSHRFRGTMNEARTYTATLTVEDDSGNTDSDTTCVTVIPLEKTVEVSHHPAVPIPDQTVFGRMTVSYNWIHDNTYVVSKIHYESAGFVGVGVISIWDYHSHKLPVPIWTADIFSFGKDKEKTYYPDLEQILYGGDTFEGISVDAFDVMNVFIEGWAGISISIGPSLPLPFFETNSACFQPDYTEVPDHPIDISDLVLAQLCSPGEVRVYDQEVRITGLVDGEVKEEIPHSAYNDGTVIILSPSDSYKYGVAGTDEGIYGLDIASVEGGEATTFTATDIPTTTGATHEYTIDWAALSQGEEGVTVQVDSDGDGEFEYTFTSDDELTQSDFLSATNVPPVVNANGPYTGIVGEPITFNSTGSYDPDGTIVSYEWDIDDDGEFDDAIGPAPSKTWDIPYSGIISLKVTDDDGGVGTDTAIITVLAAYDLKEDAITDLEAITTSNKHAQKDIDEAIKHINKSLEDSLWLDASRLDTKHGHKVFDEEKKAVKDIMHVKCPECCDACTNVIDKLVKADKILAETVLNDAISTNVTDPKNQDKVDKEIAKAEEELTKAAEEVSKGKPDKAIDHYKKAWEHAQQAIKHAQ